ncbi:MAG: MBL fold metallo-hydrolase [Candidatus Eisenbacteria bacterium]|nr:MBL fold metallo-hydrolase [Candidatus Eisenbacteria bacterium]
MLGVDGKGLAVMARVASFSAIVLFLLPSLLFAANLEIHCIDVGQGDATLVISPTGKTLLFDSGETGKGTNVVLPYLQSKGISSLDYTVVSHYHVDHIGGLDEVINGLGGSSKINVAAYDRGGSYTTQAYVQYVNAVGSKRTTFVKGQVLDLGGGATATCVALNGNGVSGVSDENDLCVVLKIKIGSFEFYQAGDLSGANSGGYKDVESSVAPLVGDVEVYRVDHHGSAYNSNQTLVNALLPEVSIISVGSNSYGHPTQTVINRLVAANSYIYQTELGSAGTIPSGKGTVVNGHVIISTNGVSTYTVHGTVYTIPGVDVTPPVISDVSAGSIGVDYSTVTWTTDEPATSQVEYGVTTSYGQQSLYNGTLLTNHAVSLSDLSPGTLYHYRVKSQDALANLAVSGDYTFTTGSAPPDTYEPNASFSSAFAPIGSGAVYESYVYTGTDNDYYKLDVAGAGAISISLTSLPKNYNMVLYDPAHRTVGSSANAGTSDEFITYNNPKAGPFFVRVYPASSTEYSKTDSYLLTATFPCAATPPSIYALDAPGNEAVLGARPNPFKGETEILFFLSTGKKVEVKVFNVRGQEVSTVVDGTFGPGMHRAVWDGVKDSGEAASSGVYFYRAKLGERVETGRIVLLR